MARGPAPGRWLVVVSLLAGCLAGAPAAMAAPGDWTGTLIFRQVIDQADGALDETYTAHWTFTPTGGTHRYSLNQRTRVPDMFCGERIGTIESNDGGTGHLDAYVSVDPATPSGAVLGISSDPGGPYPMHSTGQDCVQYSPGSSGS